VRQVQILGENKKFFVHFFLIRNIYIMVAFAKNVARHSSAPRQKSKVK
jgi:hypothetical protein